MASSKKTSQNTLLKWFFNCVSLLCIYIVIDINPIMTSSVRNPVRERKILNLTAEVAEAPDSVVPRLLVQLQGDSDWSVHSQTGKSFYCTPQSVSYYILSPLNDGNIDYRPGRGGGVQNKNNSKWSGVVDHGWWRVFLPRWYFCAPRLFFALVLNFRFCKFLSCFYFWLLTGVSMHSVYKNRVVSRQTFFHLPLKQFLFILSPRKCRFLGF